MKKLPTPVKVLLFFSLGLLILWLVYQNEAKNYDGDLMSKIWSDFKTINPIWMAMVMLGYLISNFARASRWQMLVKPLGYQSKWSNAFWTVMIGYMTNLGLPRSGEVARALAFSQYEKIPFEKTMGTVVVDRIVDVISFAIVLLLGFVFSYQLMADYLFQNGQLPTDKLVVLGLLGIAGLAALWILFKSKRFENNIFATKIKSFVSGIGEGIATIAKLENVGRFIFYSVVIWLMYYLMTYLAFFTFVPTSHLTPVAGLIVFIFGSLGMIIPTPGGMGSYQALIVIGLGLYGVSSDDAFSFAMILFLVINILINLLLGLVALVILPILNAHYNPVRTK